MSKYLTEQWDKEREIMQDFFLEMDKNIDNDIKQLNHYLNLLKNIEKYGNRYNKKNVIKLIKELQINNK